MIDIKICLLRYLVVIPLFVGLLIGVALMTEMFIAIQAYMAMSVGLLFLLWRVDKAWKEVLLFVILSLLCIVLATYIGICGTLVSANGTLFIYGGWSAMVALNCVVYAYHSRSGPRSEKKNSIVASLISFAIAFLILACISSIHFMEEVKPFPSQSRFFEPPTINAQILNETYGATVAHSRCSPPDCNRLVFDESYSVSSNPLPDGFSAFPDPYSKSSAIISYNGNGSLPFSCKDYKVYLKCSAVYEVYIGSIWIGKQCPYVKREPTLLHCEAIDTAVATYLYWFGCAAISLFVHLKWLYYLQITKEEEQSETQFVTHIQVENGFHSTENSEG